jgi:ubiquinone/menaquinone biosynthesis C-methylase UbiE
MLKQEITRLVSTVKNSVLDREQAPSVARRKERPGKPAGPKRAGQQTVSEGWETYAERRKDESGVGDVWSRPRRLGVDVDRPEDVVPYLDKEVFAPYLGSCDVMLEIGCGGGRLTEILLPKCKRLIAVDTSQSMLDIVQRRFGDHEGLQCYLADGRGLGEVPDVSVDAAFSYDVFVHLQHWDIYNYMLELQRILKPGGKAIIHHSNTFSELGWRSFEFQVPRQLNRHKTYNSLILNTPEVMRELVTRAGLEVVDQITEVIKRDCITLIRKPDQA